MAAIELTKRSLTDSEKTKFRKDRREAIEALQEYLPEPQNFLGRLSDKLSDKRRMRSIWQSQVGLYERLVDKELTMLSLKVIPSDYVFIKPFSDEGATFLFQCDDVVLGLTGQVFNKMGFPTECFEILLDDASEIIDVILGTKKMNSSRNFSLSKARNLKLPSQISEFKGTLDDLDNRLKVSRAKFKPMKIVDL